MSEAGGFKGRNQQAARDALRRRQKAKQAKTVKRHVRYNEKQKLLKQLESSARDAPIVASNLRRFEEDEETSNEGMKRAGRRRKIAKASASSSHEPGEENALDEKEQEKVSPLENEKFEAGVNDTSSKETSDTDGSEAEMETEIAKSTNTSNDSGAEWKDDSPKKYLPFTKQMKQAEKLKQEREAREKERLKQIKTRENMLKKSKKQRRNQVCLIVSKV